MMSTVIGGAMLPHAPQFFTMPETEDKANVERVREVAADIGAKLQGAQARPLDHLLQRPRRAVLPQRLPGLHRPCRRRGHRRVRRPQVSLEGPERDRLRDRAPALPAGLRSGLHLDREDRLRHRHSARPIIGLTDPVLPIYVNAYLPPQPTMERCYAFGQAVARTVTAARARRPSSCRAAACRISPAPTAIPIPNSTGTSACWTQLAGGQSQVADRLRRGRARRQGQHRAALLGLRRRRPRRAQARHRVARPELAPQLRLARLDRRAGVEDHAAHYPSIKPELVELTAALHALAHDAERARAIRGRRAGLCRPVQAAGRSARGADRARPAGDREDGRASAGAVPGAVADAAAAPAAVSRPARSRPHRRGDRVEIGTSPRRRGRQREGDMMLDGVEVLGGRWDSWCSSG